MSSIFAYKSFILNILISNSFKINTLPKDYLAKGHNILATQSGWLDNKGMAKPNGQSSKKIRPSKKALHEKKTELLTLLGFILGVVSWGYSVISPEPNIALGLSIFAVCGVLIFVAVIRMFSLQWIGGAVWGVICLCLFVAFAHWIVLKPIRGKEFKALLVAGYQIISECQVIPGEQYTPDWLHDQEERWRGKVSEAVDEKLDYRYAQMWHEAVVYGLVTDKDTNGYRCAQMSVSTTALEQIIAKKYDPSLPHQTYTGPMYVFQGQAQGAK